jgi:hypothetical protein
MSSSPKVTPTITHKAIIVHEAVCPTRQLDESAPPTNEEEAAKEGPPVASARQAGDGARGASHPATQGGQEADQAGEACHPPQG